VVGELREPKYETTTPITLRFVLLLRYEGLSGCAHKTCEHVSGG
jgi:hypothetical protein